ncbi:MAG: DUF3267 domain-containing protein [Balneolaceae bacterium]|nr:DUF3267 domain-containing protein [Balneolaceae bacterium]
MGENAHSISLYKANIISVGLFIPISGIFLISYAYAWGWNKLVHDFMLLIGDIWFLLFLLVAGILAHELLHGMTWKLAGNTTWSEIKFGFNWKALAPFAHCRVPLEINAYRWGAAVPGIVLGVIPFIIGMFTGSGWFALFGYIFTITAAGDILILWLIRNIEPGTLVQDHPELAGCEVVQTGK